MSEIRSVLERHARARPRAIALTDGDAGVRYGELPALIEERARRLRDRGCRVIGLRLDNGIDWVLWDLAALYAGIVCVPLPVFFHADQLRHAIATAGIDHLVAVDGIHATGIIADVALFPAGTDKITFTSGSTGAPKGVCLPQAGLERVASSIITVIDATEPVRHLSVLPLGILLENVAGVMAALLSGQQVVVRPLAALGFARPFSPDYRRLVEVVRNDDIHTLILVPELLRGLVEALERGGMRLPSLRFVAVGGARVSHGLIQRARDLGLPVFEGYGLSECGSVVTLNTPGACRAGSAGKPLPHAGVSVRDGEIIIDKPIFTGYIGAPHAGPFATGDLGALAADGFVEIRGRARNLIITSFGRNIAPEWVESVLLDEPAIAQACVYGDGLPAPCALVVPASANADPGAAIARANQRLPEYARITRWQRVPPFTVADGLMTANGRMRRDAVLDHFHTFIAQEPHDGILRSTRH